MREEAAFYAVENRVRSKRREERGKLKGKSERPNPLSTFLFCLSSFLSYLFSFLLAGAAASASGDGQALEFG
jgi:hypothetical protein